MKNRGFTLTELIAVIIILGIIASIAIASITTIVKKSKERAHEAVINEVKQAAKKIVAENIQDYVNEASEYCLEMDDIINSPHLASDEVIDPLTDKPLVGTIIIDYEDDEYTFEFRDNPMCAR